VAHNLTVTFADPNHATLVRTDQTPPKEETIASSRNFSLLQTLDLLEAIEQDRPTRTPISEGRKTLALVLAASRSGETGEVVRIA
jgi:hypothetical protein